MDYQGHKQAERQGHLSMYLKNLQLVQAPFSSSKHSGTKAVSSWFVLH